MSELRVSRDLLESFLDTDPCWFDHNGGCQAHGYLSLEAGEGCPQRELKTLLCADQAPVNWPARFRAAADVIEERGWLSFAESFREFAQRIENDYQQRMSHAIGRILLGETNR